MNDTFKITVDFYIKAEDISHAEQLVAEFIQDAILHSIDTEDKEVINEFDIIDSEPTEVF